MPQIHAHSVYDVNTSSLISIFFYSRTIPRDGPFMVAPQTFFTHTNETIAARDLRGMPPNQMKNTMVLRANAAISGGYKRKMDFQQPTAQQHYNSLSFNGLTQLALAKVVEISALVNTTVANDQLLAQAQMNNIIEPAEMNSIARYLQGNSLRWVVLSGPQSLIDNANQRLQALGTRPIQIQTTLDSSATILTIRKH